MSRAKGVASQRSKVKRSKKKPGSALLKGISKNLPSLDQAYLLTERASRVGFDWPNMEGLLKKLDEEMEELREALFLQDRRRIREEIGDLLFVLANIARFLHIHPEEALKRTLEKFTSRFHYIETMLRKEGKSFHQSNLIEMDQWWNRAKRKDRN
ncbi:MAG: MazG nucleotide pyrophosphohydrolase domain-containing protein [Thermodesulfobacteriota bacterium]